MSTEKQYMLAGRLYDPFDPELVGLRRRARDLCQSLNDSREEDEALRRRLLTELLGRGGDGVDSAALLPRLRENIHLGERVSGLLIRADYKVTRIREFRRRCGKQRPPGNSAATRCNPRHDAEFTHPGAELKPAPFHHPGAELKPDPFHRRPGGAKVNSQGRKPLERVELIKAPEGRQSRTETPFVSDVRSFIDFALRRGRPSGRRDNSVAVTFRRHSENAAVKGRLTVAPFGAEMTRAWRQGLAPLAIDFDPFGAGSCLRGVGSHEGVVPISRAVPIRGETETS